MNNKFLHISDLHFNDSYHMKGSKDGISHFDIKREILDELSLIVKEKEIGAILISGDLELGETDNLTPYIENWVEGGSKVFIVFGEHDSLEERADFIHNTKTLSDVYIFDKPGLINDNSLSFSVNGLSCKSKQENFREDFNNLEKYNGSKPGVFITHPHNLAKTKSRELGYSYYAVGHVHRKEIIGIADNSFIGRPGHIYSYWDGDGKAWPTGYIVGEFIDGKLNLEWYGFSAMQTVRLFIDPFKKNQLGESFLVVENCKEGDGEEIEKIIDGRWYDQGFRGIFEGYYNFESINFQNDIKAIIELFKGNIMVTPSDSKDMKRKYGYNRIVVRASTLLENKVLFEEYLERIFKARPKTQ